MPMLDTGTAWMGRSGLGGMECKGQTLGGRALANTSSEFISVVG